MAVKSSFKIDHSFFKYVFNRYTFLQFIVAVKDHSKISNYLQNPLQFYKIKEHVVIHE